ncbi:immunoglobulin-like domain-containing protein [Desulfitobacterium metallireducens]|uniref:Pesticidal crystal protein Cry22Aa Ig-like domain-containing protein n=1 Tax=Desulfitobacterium metallireducens DSM 15288 TaxID=871968 RepID=W0EHA6_9FIRM|nr:immunoglobulin-like domain-containing protein [Desulfitobacterium metallireducens]AHF08594.1 hypothetical protein DESME_09145 [Desulfitobacterium metallireducens DSM 15288]
MHLLNFKNRSKFAILSIFILTLCFTFLTKTVYAEDRPVHTSITVNPANQSSTNVLTISLTADYNAEEYSDATIHYQWGSDIEKTALNSVTFDAISGHNVLTFWSTVYDKHGKPINEKKQKCDFYVDTIAPGLTLVIPVQGFLINQDSIIISGTAENSTTVQINNEPAFSGVGEFSQTVPLVPGLNTITVSDTDNSTKPPTVTIITRTGFYDNLPPVITLNGEDPLVVQVGGNFSDPGATASDNYDQNVTIIASGSVDTNTVGTYTITYSAADISGNQTTKTRTVEVVDNEAPVITLNGEDPLVVQVGSNFSDPGATASDNYDQNVTVIASGSVDTNTVGTYTITYSAEDVSGNKTTKTRTVKVVDSEAPVITLNGEDPLVAQIGSNFSDPGATASDNYDQNVIIIASGSVDTNTVGTYTITYSAADISGNQTTKTRTVEVVDNEAPVITLNGEDPLVVQVGSNFSDPGATASDNYDQNVTVIASGSVDINMVGSYTLTYSAIDSNGNKASSVTRVINVVNPIPVGPELTISSPREGENLSGTQVTVTGTVEVGASLKINGAMIYPAASGNFSKAITVNLGQNTIKVIATDTAGNVTEKDIPVIAPYVTVTTPADNLLTNQATVMVTGKVLVGTPLTINNTPVTPDASGNYSFPCTLNLADGTNTITVVAGTTTVIRNVTKDTTGPILTINSPIEGENLSGTQVIVTGTVEKGASLKINGVTVNLDTSGNYMKAMTLNLGQNIIQVIATDTAGNVTEKDISVIAPYVTVTAPADNLLTNQGTVVVTGKVGVGTELTINDTIVTPDASGNYSFSNTLNLADGTNTITVVAGTTTVIRNVTKDTTGPILTINSPIEGENLSGTQVIVTGTVEVGASLKINGAMVYPDGSGNFSKAITVNLGQIRSKSLQQMPQVT